jgi:hypothetical protein
MVVLAALAAAIVVVSQGARAGPSLVSNVFGSNMILQRDRPAPIWGWVAVDSTVDGATVHQVTVTLTGTPAVTAITNADGFWRVRPPQSSPRMPHSSAHSTAAAFTVGGVVRVPMQCH